MNIVQKAFTLVLVATLAIPVNALASTTQSATNPRNRIRPALVRHSPSA